MVKKILLYSGLISAGLLIATPTLAICPVCTVVVGAGVGLSRWLGVDDTISGVWVGGLIVSSIIWFLDWLNKKQIFFRFRTLIVSILSYVLILVPLRISNVIGHPYNQFCGVDKLLFGTGLGSVVFLGSVWLHNFLKKKNNDKSFFSYQKVAIPVISLLITSIILYVITSC